MADESGKAASTECLLFIPDDPDWEIFIQLYSYF